jgi:hypothetical protein
MSSRRKSTLSEAAFMRQVIQLAVLYGWLPYHTFDSRRSQPGFPDVVLVHRKRGLCLYRELKSDTGRLSPAQQDWLAALTAAGQDAAVWRPSQWPAIQALLTGQ